MHKGQKKKKPMGYAIATVQLDNNIGKEFFGANTRHYLVHSRVHTLIHKPVEGIPLWPHYRNWKVRATHKKHSKKPCVARQPST